MRFKTKQRQHTETTERDVPAEVNDTSATVSEEAACCVADIDDALADMDDALESEEDKARREIEQLRTRYQNYEISGAEYGKQAQILKAKYGHLNLGCWC